MNYDDPEELRKPIPVDWMNRFLLAVNAVGWGYLSGALGVGVVALVWCLFEAVDFSLRSQMRVLRDQLAVYAEQRLRDQRG